MDSIKEYKTPEGKGCGKCCRSVIVPFPYQITEDLKRWYMYHDIEIKNGQMRINNKCEKLSDDGWCTIYPDRPGICKSYNCEKNKNKVFDENRECDLIQIGRKNG